MIYIVWHFNFYPFHAHTVILCTSCHI